MEITVGHSPTNNVYKFEVKIDEMRKLPIVALFGIPEIWLIFYLVLHIGYWFLHKFCVYCI